jgi:hypothetical protein
MSHGDSRRPGDRGHLLMRLCWCVIVLLLAATLSACAAPRPAPPTASPAPVEISPDQLAVAMQEDRFFADYGQQTLLVRGTVDSVSNAKNHHTVEFRTGSPIRVLCDLGQALLPEQPGDTITVRAPASEVVRRPQASAVMLKVCLRQ